MPNQIDLLNRAGVADFIAGRVEVALARRDGRTPTVSLSDLADLEERLGVDAAGTLDALVMVQARHAFGLEPHKETTDFLKDVRELYGASVIHAAIEVIDSLIKAAQKRSTRTETRDGAVGRYMGVWRRDGAYKAGDMVTDRGTLFYCRKSTAQRPGTSDAWQLMVKNQPRAA